MAAWRCMPVAADCEGPRAFSDFRYACWSVDRSAARLRSDPFATATASLRLTMLRVCRFRQLSKVWHAWPAMVGGAGIVQIPGIPAMVMAARAIIAQATALTTACAG